MENTTRLLQRHQPTLASRQVLIVDANDAALRHVSPGQVVLHTDLASVPADQFQAVPSVPPGTDLLIVILPKSRERLDFLLAALAGELAAPLECWLVGPGKGGIRGALKQFRQAAGEPVLLDSARHCRLYQGVLAPAAPLALANFERCWRQDGLQICSLPGVFSHGRTDDGTALLMEELAAQPVSGAVLEVGCGAGVLTAMLAAGGARVTAVDVSATAVLATRRTLAANALEAQVTGSDLYQQVSGRFDAICTNPPFHDGIARTIETTRLLIQGARARLVTGGELVLVANHGLPYGEILADSFAQVTVARENNRFRVWRCR